MFQVNNRSTYIGVKRFKFNNKDTRTALLTARKLYYFWYHGHTKQIFFSSDDYVHTEHANSCWNR